LPASARCSAVVTPYLQLPLIIVSALLFAGWWYFRSVRAARIYQDTFAFLDPRLERVCYLKLSPPIEITHTAGDEIQIRVRREPFRIQPPAEKLAALCEDIASRSDGLSPGTDAFSRRVDELAERYKTGRFPETVQDNSHDRSPQLRVFSALVRDESALGPCVRKRLLSTSAGRKAFISTGHFSQSAGS
jgi:hypothetical protein